MFFLHVKIRKLHVQNPENIFSSLCQNCDKPYRRSKRTGFDSTGCYFLERLFFFLALVINHPARLWEDPERRRETTREKTGGINYFKMARFYIWARTVFCALCLCRRVVGTQGNGLFENAAFADAPYHAVLSALGAREKYFMSQEGAVRR